MGSNTYTLYFRQIPEGYNQDRLHDVFAKYGEIINIFVHKDGQYGMVEFPDNRSCDKAIEALHLNSPLNLYVNYAKTSKKERSVRESDTESTSSSNRTFNENMNHSRNFAQKKHHQSSNTINLDNYDPEDILYIDRFGKVIDVLCDENGVVYAPIHQVTGVRRVVKKNSALAEDYLHNPENYLIIDKENNDTTSTQAQNTRPQQNMGERRNFQQSNDNFQRQEKQMNDSRNNFDRGARNDRFRQQNDARNSDDNRDMNNSRNSFDRPNKSFGQNQRNDRFGRRNQSDSRQMNSAFDKSRVGPKNDEKQSNNIEEEVWMDKSPNKSPIQTSKPLPQKTDQKYSLISLPLNQDCEVMVYSLEDNQIWVQPTSETEKAVEIVALAEKIASEAKTLSISKVGTTCLGNFEGVWCRAVITNTTPLTIRYVDFGNSEKNPSNLKEIPENLLKMPALAFQIVFKGKKPELAMDDALKVHILEKNDDIYYVKVPGEILQQAKVESKPLSVEKSSSCPKDLMIYGKLNPGDDGLLIVSKILSPGNFVAGFLPTAFADDIAFLEKFSREKHHETTLNPKVGDMVYAKNSTAEGAYCRAVIIETSQNSFKVGFIDYGTEENVEEVSPLPQELSKIPWFSCVCIVPSQHAAKFSTDQELNYTVINVSEKSAVIRIVKDEEEICFGQMESWDPTQKEKVDVSKTINNVINHPKPKTPEMVQIKNGEIVCLVFENNNLYVRNKECRDHLIKIESNMESFVRKAQNLSSPPTVKQIVLAAFEGSFYRAVIEDIKGDRARITFIDYGNEEEMPWKQFKTLPSDFEPIPQSLVKVTLKNHTGSFTKEEQKVLSNLSENEAKFKVTYDDRFDQGVDLQTKEGKSITNLLKPEITSTPKGFSKLLKNITPKTEAPKVEFKVPGENDPIILVSELPITEIKSEEVDIKILEVMDPSSGTVSFCVHDESQMKKIFTDLRSNITNYITKLPNVPYKASTEEIVLVKCENEWRRGLFLESNDNSCEIFCVDHGIQIETTLSNVRRISPDMVKDHALAIIGMINNYTNYFNGKDDDQVKRNKYRARVLEKDPESGAYTLQLC